MRTLVQLSDLHFGAIDARLLEPLRRRIVAIAPDLVVVSGDLTQRARSRQFREARAFLDSLPKPQLVVPGNHDVPLYNVFRRFFAPLDGYRRYISPDLEPAYLDDEIAVVGVNTARSLAFKGGRINEEQVARVRGVLCDLPEAMTKLVVTHHPFDTPDHWDDAHAVAGRAAMALKALADCGADVYLSGHLHRAHSGEPTVPFDIGGVTALMVSAGTATSTRERGEANAFNTLRIESRHILVEHYEWSEAAGEFSLARANAFRSMREGWRRA